MQFGNSSADAGWLQLCRKESLERGRDQRAGADRDPDWFMPLRSVSVSCRVAEGLVGICADCPLVIVPALPLAESVPALRERLGPASVVLSAKLGAAAAMSRAAAANAIESFIMRCSMLVKA